MVVGSFQSCIFLMIFRDREENKKGKEEIKKKKKKESIHNAERFHLLDCKRGLGLENFIIICTLKYGKMNDVIGFDMDVDVYVYTIINVCASYPLFTFLLKCERTNKWLLICLQCTKPHMFAFIINIEYSYINVSIQPPNWLIFFTFSFFLFYFFFSIQFLASSINNHNRFDSIRVFYVIQVVFRKFMRSLLLVHAIEPSVGQISKSFFSIFFLLRK